MGGRKNAGDLLVFCEEHCISERGRVGMSDPKTEDRKTGTVNHEAAPHPERMKIAGKRAAIECVAEFFCNILQRVIVVS